MSYTVAITGRPNVGKSTFFNRMLEQRKAIVDDFSGVTRDRQYGVAEWVGKTFNVIDTGGFVAGSSDVFEKAIRKQVHIAVEEANAIIFMVDVATGITALDEEMANVLRRTTKPVYLVVNKVDNHKRQLEAAEFYSLGFEKVFFLSSISGTGTGELLDQIVEDMPAERKDVIVSTAPKFAIIGQPNVGKSSLLNALAGADVAIVTAIAGTTRDKVTQTIQIAGIPINIIDTAGIRDLADAPDEVERIGIERTWQAVASADLILHVLDAAHGPTLGDEEIANRLPDKVPVIRIWNKIDVSGHKPALDVLPDTTHIYLSAAEGTGMDLLRDEILRLGGWQQTGESLYLARERHLIALKQAQIHLNQASELAAQNDQALDLFAEELRLAATEYFQMGTEMVINLRPQNQDARGYKGRNYDEKYAETNGNLGDTVDVEPYLSEDEIFESSI